MNIFKTESHHTSGVYGKRDLALVRGQGAVVWDSEGRVYIDCTAGIGVANIGHSHPHLVQALTRQGQTLITSQEMFYDERRAQLYQQLAELLPPGMNRFFLGNSGTEAVEAALKFARLSTGRTEVVAAMRGFHGRTFGALSATHKKNYRQPFAPLVPGFTHVPFGQIKPLSAAVSTETAAVILEVVQGEGGVRVASREYFHAVQELCVQTGVLLIVDEVQTGYGRTGTMFACEQFDLVPDMLCMGKAMAGGVPMGAVALGPRIDSLPVGAHGSTFGGNPLACAAAIGVLEIFAAEQLVQRAAENGAYFLAKLQSINSDRIREVRGLGLMLGVELKERAMPVVQELMNHGILALTAGTTVIRLLPPLVISRQEIDGVVSALEEVLR